MSLPSPAEIAAALIAREELPPEKGDRGDKGDSIKGDPGAKGDTVNGDRGDNGKDGRSMLAGAGQPAATLGKAGDLYLDTVTGDVEVQDATGWRKVGNLRGPAAKAATDGRDGASIFAGAGEPVGPSREGDLYLETVTGDLYRFDTGAWHVIGNLRGPKGETGSTGRGGLFPRPGGGGSGSLAIQDEGAPVVSTGTLDFAGAGVSVAQVGAKAVVTIPGVGAGTLADTLTAGNETDGTPIVANVPDDFEDVLLVETPDTGDLSGNGYVIRILDTVNNHHIFDLDAYGSILMNGPFDPGAGTAGLDVAGVLAAQTNGFLVAIGTQRQSTLSITEAFTAHIDGSWVRTIGFFDKAAATATQQTAATLSDLWTGLKAYGLLDAGSVAPAAGGSGSFLSIAKWT